MIHKKQLKNNSKKKTSQGYDLNNIKTKKASQPKKKNGALHGFFSLMGFVIGIGSIMAMVVPLGAHAKQGVTIVEPFSCEVWLADYKELTRSVKENNPKFLQEQLEISLEAITKELGEHSECEGDKNE